MSSPDTFGSADAPATTRVAAVLANDKPIADTDITLLLSVSFTIARLAPLVIAARVLIGNTDATNGGAPSVFLVAGPPAFVTDPSSAAINGLNGVSQIAGDGNGTVQPSSNAPRSLPVIYAPLATGVLAVALWVHKPGTSSVLVARGRQQPLIGSPAYGSGNWFPTSLEVAYPST